MYYSETGTRLVQVSFLRGARGNGGVLRYDAHADHDLKGKMVSG